MKMRKIIVTMMAAAMVLTACSNEKPSQQADTAPTATPEPQWRAGKTFASGVMTTSRQSDPVIVYIDDKDAMLYYDDFNQSVYGQAKFPKPVQDKKFAEQNLSFPDIDNDGVSDLCIPCKIDGNDVYNYCYRWDEEYRKFKLIKGAEKLPNLSFQNGIIVSQKDSVQKNYQYKKGKLKEMKEKTAK